MLCRLQGVEDYFYKNRKYSSEAPGLEFIKKGCRTERVSDWNAMVDECYERKALCGPLLVFKC